MVESVLLIFSALEVEKERVAEIFSYQLPNGEFIVLKSLDNPKNNIWWAGSKQMSNVFYAGAYKQILLEAFITHIKNKVLWEYPEDVQILVHSDYANDTKYRLFEIE